jgi:hypothetical protein
MVAGERSHCHYADLSSYFVISSLTPAVAQGVAMPLLQCSERSIAMIDKSDLSVIDQQGRRCGIKQTG